MQTTGWPPGMLQDDSRELSRWLSTRLGACYQIQRNNMPNWTHSPFDKDSESSDPSDQPITKWVSDNTGGKVKVTYHKDGASTYHWGGPCGDQEFDRNGDS